MVTPPTLVEAAATELRRRILSGHYRPGERISEEALSMELAISRPPLREAMRLLERDGLLVGRPRRGVFVTPLTAEDVREIYTLRSALDSLAIELALPIRRDQDLDELRRILREMRDASAGQPDAATMEELNLRFHLGVARLSGHKRLQAVYETMMSQLQLCMAINLRFRQRLTGDPAEAVVRHAELLALIENGDVQAAMDGLRNHGDRAFLDNLEDLLEEVQSKPSGRPPARGRGSAKEPKE